MNIPLYFLVGYIGMRLSSSSEKASEHSQLDEDIIQSLITSLKGDPSLVFQLKEDLEVYFKGLYKKEFDCWRTPGVESVLLSLVARQGCLKMACQAESLAECAEIDVISLLRGISFDSDLSSSGDEDSFALSSCKSKEIGVDDSLKFSFNLSKDGADDDRILATVRNFVDEYSSHHSKQGNISIPPCDQEEFHSLISKMINLSQTKEEEKVDFLKMDKALTENIEVLKRLVIKKLIYKTVENQKLQNIITQVKQDETNSLMSRKRLD